MGRNGKQVPVFMEMVKFVNNNVGKTVNSKEILLGNNPGRNSATAYLYKFVKLGYVKSLDDGLVKNKDTTYIIQKEFPKNYNSIALMDELRIVNGMIPNKAV